MIQAGKRTAQSPREIVSIGTGSDVDIRFASNGHEQIFPAHACLITCKGGLEVSRLTPGAEVLCNGRILADKTILSQSCVLQIGAKGPLMHLEFKEAVTGRNMPGRSEGKSTHIFDRHAIVHAVVRVIIDKLIDVTLGGVLDLLNPVKEA